MNILRAVKPFFKKELKLICALLQMAIPPEEQKGVPYLLK